MGDHQVKISPKLRNNAVQKRLNMPTAYEDFANITYSSKKCLKVTEMPRINSRRYNHTDVGSKKNMFIFSTLERT